MTFQSSKTVSTKNMTKKEEPLKLNLAEPVEIKNLIFPVRLC